MTFEEREEISRGLAAGRSFRAIATRFGRAPSTISREMKSNGGPRRTGRDRGPARLGEGDTTQAMQAGHQPGAGWHRGRAASATMVTPGRSGWLKLTHPHDPHNRQGGGVWPVGRGITTGRRRLWRVGVRPGSLAGVLSGQIRDLASCRDATAVIEAEAGLLQSRPRAAAQPDPPEMVAPLAARGASGRNNGRRVRRRA